jgi:hypothetical protein
MELSRWESRASSPHLHQVFASHSDLASCLCSSIPPLQPKPLLDPNSCIFHLVSSLCCSTSTQLLQPPTSPGLLVSLHPYFLPMAHMHLIRSFPDYEVTIALTDTPNRNLFRTTPLSISRFFFQAILRLICSIPDCGLTFFFSLHLTNTQICSCHFLYHDPNFSGQRGVFCFMIFYGTPGWVHSGL